MVGIRTSNCVDGSERKSEIDAKLAKFDRSHDVKDLRVSYDVICTRPNPRSGDLAFHVAEATEKAKFHLAGRVTS